MSLCDPPAGGISSSLFTLVTWFDKITFAGLFVFFLEQLQKAMF